VTIGGADELQHSRDKVLFDFGSEEVLANRLIGSRAALNQ